MPRRIVVLLAATLLTVGIALPATAATAADFGGVWTSTDSVDGSNQALIVIPTGAQRARVILIDDGATVCGGSPLTPALATGRGSVSGEDMTVTYRLFCFNGSPASPSTVVYTLQPDDTLTEDLSATVWSH